MQCSMGFMDASIPSPKRATDTSDRQLCCEEALEVAYREFVSRAQQAGWKALEITVALQSLGDHHMLSIATIEEADRLLAEVLKHHRR